MKEIHVLLTSVGGLVSPGMIKSIQSEAKKHHEKIHVIGIDTQQDAVGYHFVEKHYVVPNGTSQDYIPTIREIAERENIDVIIPCSDEELLSIAKERERFLASGIHCICSDFEIVSRANDKGSMLEFSRKMQIPTPQFYIPLSIDEVEEAARELHYPSSPFIVKPRLARGGRGFKIIKDHVDLLDTNILPLNHLIDILRKYPKFPDIVLMEFLPGDDYSVDALANHGEPFYIIPRRRIKAISGPSIVGEIVENNEVKDMVRRIISAFSLHLNINIQLKYSASNVPLVYEINPRVSGTIVANAASGINLLYYGLKLSLEEEIPRNLQPHPVKMSRYFEEIFY